MKLVVVMGITWILDVISWLVGGPHYFWYLTDFINAAQGFFIFCVVGLQPQVGVSGSPLGVTYLINPHVSLVDPGGPEALLELQYGRREHDHEWGAAFQLLARSALDGRVRDEPDDQQQQHFQYNEGAPGDGLLRGSPREEEGL